VSQIKANEKILKVTKVGLYKLKPFFNIKQFIGSGVNLTPASHRRVNLAIPTAMYSLMKYQPNPGRGKTYTKVERVEISVEIEKDIHEQLVQSSNITVGYLYGAIFARANSNNFL